MDLSVQMALAPTSHLLVLWHSLRQRERDLEAWLVSPPAQATRGQQVDVCIHRPRLALCSTNRLTMASLDPGEDLRRALSTLVKSHEVPIRVLPSLVLLEGPARQI
jgi:hypothetical protein